jgi:hypothetical protein
MLLNNDIYSFECFLCGCCCRGHTKIQLNPHDLWKMAVYCGYNTTEQLFKDKLIICEKGQHDILMPYIRFKKKPFSFCPFLINKCDDTLQLERGLCALHPRYKPLVCSMAPLGREIDFETGTISYLFIPPAQGCPGLKSHHSKHLKNVTATLAEELDYEERYFRILQYICHLPDSAQREIEELYFFNTKAEFPKKFEEFEKRYIIEV